MYSNSKKATILLEDGTIFYGDSIGTTKTVTGEICFNTGMTGYQEIFTDPSYFGQILVATNVHIGNYGINLSEQESNKIQIKSLICKNFSKDYSRYAATDDLLSYLNKNGIPIIENVDTRALVRHIREKGAMNAIISIESDISILKKELQAVPSMEGMELASQVSTKNKYTIGNQNAIYKIAALDLGIKQNILKNLIKRDCIVTVYPFNTTFEQMETSNPDGYFLSNGPGDPKPLKEAQLVAKQIIATNKPLFGICLGHQIIALANGMETYKMHNGHRGINHPVKNIITGKGEITSQNHGFVVDKKQVEDNPEFEITHVHLNDNTLAGMKMKNKNCFSVQFHPEASPGPHDSSYLFDEFIDRIKLNKSK